MIIFVLAAILGGCAVSPAVSVPIATISRLSGNDQSDTLIIMLPGYGDRANTFVDQKFFDLAPKVVDLISVDAHFGYYENRSIINRLHQDVVLPAVQDGYRSIWMLGVSMGGVGAINYADQHPGMISGLILIAPFPGEKPMVEEVRAAGGLKHWVKSEESYEQDMWQWLKTTTTECETPVILGFGQSDKLAPANQMLADQLSRNSVFSLPGNHNWKTWRPIWKSMVDLTDFTHPAEIQVCRE